MKLATLSRLIVLACASSCAFAADIVLTPPAGGGVSVTNAAGNVTQFRVADDGSVTIPGTLYKGAEPFFYTFGDYNTFIGLSAGNSTMTGSHNTGFGGNVLAANTTGTLNTAMGSFAFSSNTTGYFNSALGESALRKNMTGNQNTAAGRGALYANTTGNSNTAIGNCALCASTTGDHNTAMGANVLITNTTGFNNVAIGDGALIANSTGANNIALGTSAGQNLSTGNFNILIGNGGTAGDNSTIRIGNAHTRAFIAGIYGVTTGASTGIPVMIDGFGQLGTVSSSMRYKDDIADMDAASSALMKLRPVTFHYKADQDPAGRTLQYGLVAEEVEAVYPGLVAHAPDGQVETVLYHFLPPMLLNEVQKQQRTIEAQAARIEAQSVRIETQAARLSLLEEELAGIRRLLAGER